MFTLYVYMTLAERTFQCGNKLNSAAAPWWNSKQERVQCFDRHQLLREQDYNIITSLPPPRLFLPYQLLFDFQPRLQTTNLAPEWSRAAARILRSLIRSAGDDPARSRHAPHQGFSSGRKRSDWRGVQQRGVEWRKTQAEGRRMKPIGTEMNMETGRAHLSGPAHDAEAQMNSESRSERGCSQPQTETRPWRYHEDTMR